MAGTAAPATSAAEAARREKVRDATLKFLEGIRVKRELRESWVRVEVRLISGGGLLSDELRCSRKIDLSLGDVVGEIGQGVQSDVGNHFQ